MIQNDLIDELFRSKVLSDKQEKSALSSSRIDKIKDMSLYDIAQSTNSQYEIMRFDSDD